MRARLAIARYANNSPRLSARRYIAHARANWMRFIDGGLNFTGATFPPVNYESIFFFLFSPCVSENVKAPAISLL